MQENHAKVTPEFAKGKVLIFCPASKDEAVEVQQRLFAMGYAWHTAQGESVDIQNPEACIKLKMVLLNGKIYLCPQVPQLLNGILCTTEQLKPDYVAPPVAQGAAKSGKAGADDVDELTALEKKIAECGMTEEARIKCEKEFKKLCNLNPQAPEVEKIQTYLEKMVSFPWTERSETEQDSKKVRATLDAGHHGRKEVKDRIVEDAAVQKRRGKPSGAILCLVGEPGVGKTSLGQGIADALGRKFVRIALGGVDDETEIRGHRRTYVDSAEGRIMQGMAKAGTINPVMMLDEVDKLGSKGGAQVAAALLEVLDPAQNHKFVDRYTGVEYDLSNVMLICTANVLEDIPEALRDRMEIMYLSGYPDEEKMEIAKEHLIPRQREDNNLTEAEFSITDAALAKLIDGYTYEAGVRKLEQQVANLARKAVVEFEQDGVESVTITPENLEQYAGPKKIERELVDPTPRVGHGNGLAVTGATGKVLEIEAAMYADPKGGVEATGNLMQTIEESVRYSAAYIKSIAAKLGIPKERYLNNTLHIKIAKGGVPVDGPSAGLMLATLEASVWTGIPIRGDVAMTGEISVLGESGPIGGLPQKLDGAFKAGIRTVLIPQANLKDLEDSGFPKKLKEQLEIMPDANADNLGPVPEGKMRIIPVKDEWEVLQHALVEMPKPLAMDENLAAGKNNQVLLPEGIDANDLRSLIALAKAFAQVSQPQAPANDIAPQPEARHRRPAVVGKARTALNSLRRHS